MSKIDQAAVFAALGDPVRLQLLDRMAAGGSIKELSVGLPITRQAVTRHLMVLEQVGLVQAKKAGREMRFAPLPDKLAEANSWLEEVMRQWDSALAELKGFVETGGT